MKRPANENLDVVARHKRRSRLFIAAIVFGGLAGAGLATCAQPPVGAMMALRVSDHALVRFLERAGGLDVEAVRAALAASLARASEAAERVGERDCTIHADGLVYVVKNETLVTIVPDTRRRR